MINKNDMLNNFNYCLILAEKIQFNYFSLLNTFYKIHKLLNTEITKYLVRVLFSNKSF